MMPRDRQVIGACPKCSGVEYTCTFNHFERDELTIDSWEHRCTDCGHRETSAIRSDDELDDEPEKVLDPTLCPFCGRQGQSEG